MFSGHYVLFVISRWQAKENFNKLVMLAQGWYSVSLLIWPIKVYGEVNGTKKTTRFAPC